MTDNQQPQTDSGTASDTFDSVTEEPPRIVHRSNQPHPASPRRLILLGSALGAFLVTGGIIWVAVLRGKNLWEAWFVTDSISPLADIVLGIIVGIIFSLILWYAGQHVEGFRHIRRLIAATIDLPALTPRSIVFISLIAAIPEEIFFRGAVQPVVGLVPAAFIFGILHAITPLYFVYATIAGFGLGLLQGWYGALWLPIAAHFSVDVIALWLLARWSKEKSDLTTESPVPQISQPESQPSEDNSLLL